MPKEKDEKRLRQVGNSRGENSLVWAGFALTNFVTIVALFSALDVEKSPLFQVASFLFLAAGSLFAVGWALYEAVGSANDLRLAEEAKWYKFWRLRSSKTDRFVSNPRQTYINQAEYCSIFGTFIWLIGVSLLLWDLEMTIASIVWLFLATTCWLWAVPRFKFWRKKKK